MSKLPEIRVPKLTAENYDILTTAFFVVGRAIGLNRIPIDYFMRGVTGSYDYPWTNWEDKLKNCLLRTDNSFNNYIITLYWLYSQYIGTKGVGSNILNKYHSTKNGPKYHQYFEVHFQNDAYMTNRSTTAISTINSSVYNGDRRKFTLENYYTKGRKPLMIFLLQDLLMS